ncbi:hypothetical protein HDZ31DRAFT_69996, partial [Schizophyllum fasciatum]
MPGPPLDIAVAGALCALAALSAILFRFTQPKAKGGLLLEEVSNTDSDISPNGDPFAVTTPADVLEGFPVREPAFWRRTRARHLLIAALLAGAVSATGAALVASSVTGDALSIARLLDGVVALYLLCLSFVALARSRGPSSNEDPAKAPWMDRIALHEHVVLHQCGVGIPASLGGAVVALVPSYGPTTSSDSFNDIAFLVHVVLLSAAIALAMAVPMGPELWLPPRQIYDEKLMKDYEEKKGSVIPADSIEGSGDTVGDGSATAPLLPVAQGEGFSAQAPNVAAVRTASLWSTFLFSYTTPVMLRAYHHSDQQSSTFDLPDLPILPANMRAPYNYTKMRAELARRQIGRVGPQDDDDAPSN